jgi:hypothetical protein
MRRELRAGLWLLASLALAGCGEPYSNEDLLFLAAVPERAELETRVPEGAEAGGAGLRAVEALAVGDDSTWHRNTREQGDAFNRSVGQMLGQLDALRRLPVSTRTEAQRVWGPFRLPEQPAFEARLRIDRAGEGAFLWALEFRRVAEAASAPWQSVLRGETSTAGSFQRARGTVELPVREVEAAGLTVGEDVRPLERLRVAYDLTGEPRQVGLELLARSGERLTYASQRAADDRSGTLVFRYQTQLVPQLPGEPADVQDTMQVVTRWREGGAGRADISILEGNGRGASALECWGADLRVVYQATSWDGARTGDLAKCVP